MRKTAEFLLDMLYPKKCPLCHEVLKDRKQLLCGKCAEKLHPFSGALCMKCGTPVRLEEEYCACLPGLGLKLRVIILQKEEVFTPKERYGGSLWYFLSITDAGNMEIFTQKP